jgi:hypothetical protein
MVLPMKARVIALALVVAGLLLAPLSAAQAGWKIIADNAVNPILVCTDGIIFEHTREFYDDATNYSDYPAKQSITFKAAFPVPPEDVNNGGYIYPANGTIIANHTFTVYKFRQDPFGIDTSDPPDGVDDAFLVYEGMSIAKWKQPRNPGDEVLLSFADFDSGEQQPIETVQDCKVFSIDIRPGFTNQRVDLRSKSPLEVAIVKRPGFNPSIVDKSTVRFGATGTEAAPISWQWKDADRDGDVDLVFKFNIAVTGINCGSTAGFLSAQTSQGDFLGGDTLTPANCKWPSSGI